MDGVPATARERSAPPSPMSRRQRLLEDAGTAARVLRSSPAYAASVVLAVAVAGGLAWPILSLRHRHTGPAWPNDVDPVRVLLEGRWPPGWGTAVESAAQHAGVLAARDLLFAFAGLSVVMACASVGALVLARAAGSRERVAVRAALGASPAAVLAEAGVEAALLAAGAVLGILGLAGAVAAGVAVTMPEPLRGWLVMRASPVSVLLGVLAPTAALLLFAPLAALPAATWRLSPILAAARTTSHPGEGALRQLLAVAQLTAALSLLVGAGLLLEADGERHSSKAAPAAVDPVAARRTVLWTVSAPADAYRSREALAAWGSSLRARVNRLPGVRATATSPGAWLADGAAAPAIFTCPRCRIGTFGTPITMATLSFHLVDAGFFSALGIPVRGRELAPGDASDGARVALINRSFEALFQGVADPIGQQVRVRENGEWYRIVGVVPDAGAQGVGSGLGTAATIYLPLYLQPAGSVDLFVQGPAGSEAGVREAAAGDGGRALRNGSLEAVLVRLAAPLRWLGRMSLGLAAAVLLLALHGVAVVAADDVRRRRRELAIRSALGATPRALFELLMRRGLFRLLAAAACATEGVGTVVWLLERMSPAAPAWNTRVYAASFAVVAAAALLATLSAARAAFRLQPHESLTASNGE